MPDESCRKCGGLLLEFSVCAKCKGTVRYICRICGSKTVEQFHEGLCFTEEKVIKIGNLSLIQK